MIKTTNLLLKSQGFLVGAYGGSHRLSNIDFTMGAFHNPDQILFFLNFLLTDNIRFVLIVK